MFKDFKNYIGMIAALLSPAYIIYNQVKHITDLIAPTVKAVYLMEEFRRRDAYTYWCFMIMFAHACIYNHRKVDELTINTVVLQYSLDFDL